MDPEREFGLIFSVLPLKSNNFISLCLILLFLELLHWISPSVKKKKVIGMNILVSNPFWFLFTCWHFFQGLLQLFGRKLLNISYESTGDKLSWLCLYFSPFKHILQNFILAAPCFLSSVLFGYQKGFPGGSVVKNLPAKAGDRGLIPGSVRSPVEGNGNPIFLPREFHGERSVWDRKELETTQLLSKHTFHYCFIVFWCMVYNMHYSCFP